MPARLAATALALLAWAALLLQLWLSLRLAAGNGQGALGGLVAYFGYFTVLTNLFVALVASRGARMSNGGRELAWRGGAVASIVVVGLGYHLLLRNVWDPQGWQKLADIALHYAVPLAALAWWLALPPRARIPASAPLRWLAWPVAYSVYALLRGELIGSYPYYFIDVGTLGWPRVLAHLGGLLVVFVLVGFAVRAIAHWRRPRTLPLPQ
jgi:hypothetical protein